jgi:alpha-L-fucosidase
MCQFARAGSTNSNESPKSAKKLLDIYLNSVGNNCYLLLNVPPNKNGVISSKDVRVLKSLGKKINSITANPILVQQFGELKQTDGYLEFKFNAEKKLKYCILQEDISKGQRVEQFDLYVLKPNGKYERAYKGTVIGNKKIVKIKANALGALLIIRQSRSTPHIKQIGFYE